MVVLMIIKHSFSALTLLSQQKMDRTPVTIFAQAAKPEETTNIPNRSASSGDGAVTRTAISDPFSSTFLPSLKQIPCRWSAACSYKPRKTSALKPVRHPPRQRTSHLLDNVCTLWQKNDHICRRLSSCFIGITSNRLVRPRELTLLFWLPYHPRI